MKKKEKKKNKMKEMIEAEVKKSFTVSDKRFWVNENEDKDTKTDASQKKKFPKYVEKLIEENKAKDQKLQECLNQFRAFKNEQDQVRKRQERYLEKQVNQSKAGFFQSLLNLIDNLDRSIEFADKNQNFEDFLSGIKMIQSQFMEKLKDNKIQKMELAGQKFDPKTSEAIDVVPSQKEEDDDIVLNIHQDGYLMEDMVVRPARVSVGKYIGEQNPDNLLSECQLEEV
ncbi:MAG: nucleotide exchange factor GrpE [Pseudomonadota bacterium]